MAEGDIAWHSLIQISMLVVKSNPGNILGFNNLKLKRKKKSMESWNVVFNLLQQKRIQLNASPIDELGEGAYESGWWCQVKCKQGTQVSMATQRAATTTRHRHTEKLSGDTYQPVYLPWPAKREGRGGANCRTNMSQYAKRRPICWIGAHDPQTPLTSVGSILT
mgnify:CR=1 FL=1